MTYYTKPTDNIRKNFDSSFPGKTTFQRPSIGSGLTSNQEKDKSLSYESSIHQHADHLYYNVTLANKNPPSSANLVSSFKETRRDQVIQNPKDFYLSMVRYNVSGAAIPWFYWNNVASGTPNGSSQPSYLVTMDYKGNNYTAYVPYFSNTTFVPDIASGAVVSPNTIDNLAVYSVEMWLKMVNSALSTCYTTLQAANLGLPANDPPFITFDASTQLFSLYSDTAVYNETLANPVGIYFNLSLFNKFNSFSHKAQNAAGGLFFNSTGKDYQIRSFDTKINNVVIGAITYLRNTAEGSVIADCFDIQALTITTNNLPVRDEYTQGNENIFPILSDFNAAGLLSSITARNNISYLPTAQYRYADLISDNPLKVFDLNFNWLDKFQVLRPVTIISGAQISMKMLFVNREVVKDKS